VSKPNTKRVTVKKCSSKEEADKELIKGLLRNEPMLFQLLARTLFDEPYELSPEDVMGALIGLNQEGLIRIGGFKDTWLSETSIDVVLSLVK